jgi:hypothetical protein
MIEIVEVFVHISRILESRLRYLQHLVLKYFTAHPFLYIHVPLCIFVYFYLLYCSWKIGPKHSHSLYLWGFYFFGCYPNAFDDQL